MASNDYPFKLDPDENFLLMKLIYSMVNKEASKRPLIEAVIKQLDEIEGILKANARKRRVDSDDD